MAQVNELGRYIQMGTGIIKVAHVAAIMPVPDGPGVQIYLTGGQVIRNIGGSVADALRAAGWDQRTRDAT